MTEDHRLPFRRQRLRIDGFDYSDPAFVYFATLCASRESQPFNDARLAQQVIDAINWSRAAGRWRVFCHCLMPEHLHLAISTGRSGMNLSRVIGAFKTWTTRLAWQSGVRGGLWQRSWYDHVARQEEDLLTICEYIINNPVRCGLVEEAAAWPYSGMLDPLPL